MGDPPDPGRLPEAGGSPELRKFARCYAAGAIGALYDAVAFCSAGKLLLPDWVIAELQKTSVHYFRQKRFGKRGRTAGPLNNYHAALVHCARWNQVTIVRDRQLERIEDLRGWLRISSAEKILASSGWRRHVLANPNPGILTEEIFPIASRLLRRTVAAGTPATMQASYNRIERLKRTPAYHLYYWPSDLTLKLLGFDDLLAIDDAVYKAMGDQPKVDPDALVRRALRRYRRRRTD